MSERGWERFWIGVACLAILVVLMIAATTEADAATPMMNRYQPANTGTWCGGNDDQVQDVDGVCHDVDSYIDAYVDANPPVVTTIILP